MLATLITFFTCGLVQPDRKAQEQALPTKPKSLKLAFPIHQVTMQTPFKRLDLKPGQRPMRSVPSTVRWTLGTIIEVDMSHE
jgi:hypothetical protein